MLDFRPPKDSPVLINVLKLLLPAIMKVSLGESKIDVLDSDLEKFRLLRGKRALVCPNHSNRRDPYIMFAFSKLIGEDFNYIAAREVFDWNNGLNGWFLQHAGTYSVVRGAVDRESFKTTRSILATGKKKLVLFPEGEISRQNDSLMPLESGAAQLSFWAMNDVQKSHPDETLHIVPMALKYLYTGDINVTLRASLMKLEEKLSTTSPGEDLRVRVRNVAETLLGVLEREYSVKPAEDASMNDRVDLLRREILKSVARQVDIELPETGRELEHVRILRNTIDDFIYQQNGSDLSAYETRVHEEKAANYGSCYRDLDRVVNFISIYDGYLSEHMTQERCADIIDRLETEILGGSPSYKGPRRVSVRVGEPIDLKARMEDYKKGKKQAVARVTDEIFSQISSMLNEIEEARKPVYLN